jgi:xanthine dehydrogenase YagT iron-sulfur-binding subunit
LATQEAPAAQPTISASQKIPVTLTINGVAMRLEVAPWTTLLDALRDHWTGAGSIPASRSR